MTDEKEIEELNKELEKLKERFNAYTDSNKEKTKNVFFKKIKILQESIKKSVPIVKIINSAEFKLSNQENTLTIKFYWNGILIERNNKQIEKFEIVLSNFKSIDADYSYRGIVQEGQNDKEKIKKENQLAKLKSEISYYKSKIKNCENFSESLYFENLMFRRYIVNKKTDDEFDDVELINFIKRILF